ncbi:MAG TPA: hypothetical protein PKV80_29170, partial [Leptospiraceae bacterium]|nr:hypothetical protein [Leptospiraceae bacterium]
MKTRELLVVSLILVLVSCWAGPVTLSGQKNAQKKAAQQAEKNKQLELALAGLLNTGTTACQVPENTELRDDLSGYENGILKFRKEAGPKLKKGMMLRLQPTEKIPTGFLGKIQETEATPNDTLAVTAEPVPLDKICSEFSAAEDYDSLSRQVNFSNGKISIQEEVREGS